MTKEEKDDMMEQKLMEAILYFTGATDEDLPIIPTELQMFAIQDSVKDKKNLKMKDCVDIPQLKSRTNTTRPDG